MEQTFGLYEVDQTPGFEGLPDIETLRAVSSDEDKLREFCSTTYNKWAGQPEKFSWDNYFIVMPVKITIV